ncbi:sp110 nuclear body protein isoform X2 [Cynocephalus volans]|uniref:sp110 nuclear body protein isoform X2 n=1 Tax=Cynocephalus volans TaxID=110931 RepID=UPI002FC9BD9C
MFPMTRALEEALLQHFIYQKLEIAYAIHKPFPFFEGLLDNSLITERMYRESLEACRNLVPVSRVVHNILTKLEKTFNLSLLTTLFSQINLHEYPNLKTILRSFRRVGTSYGQWSRTAADPAEGSSLQPLSLLPAPPPSPPSRPPCAPGVSEPGASSQQSNETLGEPPSPSDPVTPLPGLVQERRSSAVTNDNLTPKVNEERDSQEVPSPPAGTVQVTNDNLTPKVNEEGDLQEVPGPPAGPMQVPSDNKTPQVKDKEDPPEMSHAPSGPMPVTSDDSPEPNDSEEHQETSTPPLNKKGRKRKRCIWSTPKRRRQKKSFPRGAALPRHGIQEKLQAVDQVTQRKDDSTWNLAVTRAQKARTENAHRSRSEGPVDDQVCLGKSPGEKQKKRKRDGRSSSTRKQKKRLLRGPVDDQVCLGKSPGEKQKKRKRDGRSSSTRKQKKRLLRGPVDDQVCLGESPGEKQKKRKRDGRSSSTRKQKKRLLRGPVDDQVCLGKSPGEKQKKRKRDGRSSSTRKQEKRLLRGPVDDQVCLGKSPGEKQKKRKRDGRSSSTRKQKKRLLREKPKEDTLDFLSPILPVTCGEAKGILYKKKMEQGSSEKCIQNEEGVWFTPKEFEIEGKGRNTKNWKRSLRCREKTLGELQKEGLLLCPPRVNLKREVNR